MTKYLSRSFRFVLFLVALTGVLLYTRVGTPEPVQAATSSNLNFQARLLNSSGAIVPDGSYNVEFKLYNVASAGTALWTEAYYDSNGVTAGNDNRVTVKAGYLSVYLGSQTAFPAINWDQDLWLTMNIGGTTQTATPTYDGEMTPRLKLTAVPYAFAAGQIAKYNGAQTGTLQFSTVANSPVITLPDATGTVAVSATGNIALSASGQISFTGQLAVTNGGTGSNSAQGAINNLSGLTTNGDLLYHDGTNSTRLARGTNGQCLQSNNTSLTWGACGAVGTFVNLQAGTPGTQQSGNINVSGTIISTSLLVQNATGENGLVFDGSTKRLRVYENVANPTKYAEIYYDNGEAVFAASSGNTRVGNGSGSIIMSTSATADVLTYSHSATLTSAYSGTDASVTRTLSGGANTAGGSVFKITDNSTASGGTAINPTLLLINQAATGGVISGNLIDAQLAGVSRFSVTTAGNGNFAGTLTVDGNTTMSGNLTVDGNTIIGNATTDRLTVTSQILGGSPLAFQGATDNTFTTTLGVTDPTANQTYMLPNAPAGTYDICTSANNCTALGAYINNTTTVQSNANVAIQSAGDSSVTALIRARAGQTADLLQFQNSAGTAALSGINSAGSIYFRDATSSFTSTISVQAGSLSASNKSLTLPNAGGELCTSSGNCIGNGGSGDVFKNGQTGPLIIGTNDATSFYLESGGVNRVEIQGDGDVFVGNSTRITGSATSVLTGSIDPTASTAVTGVGTLFTTQLTVGDRITVNAETRTVTVITSDTALTVATAFTDTLNDTSVDRLPASLVVRSSSNTPQLVVNDQGYVGIGTAAPSQALDVIGSIRTSDTAGSGFGTLIFGDNTSRYIRGNAAELQIGPTLNDIRFMGTGTGQIESDAASGTTAIKLNARASHTSGNLLEVSNAGFTKASIDYNGALTAVGINSGTGLLQGSGGLTLTGSANINATGTANTAIGNATGTLSVTSSAFNLDTSGAISGVSTLSTSGIITVGGLGTASNDTVVCRNGTNQLAACNSTFATTTQLQGYVQFTPASAQSDASANASIYINDTGGGNLLHLQSGAADKFVVDTSGNTTIGGTLSVTGNTVLGANSSLRITGGTTANRPASPAEGMLFYDTDTKQMLVYGNAAWQNMSRSSTKVVAASNSQTPAGADYQVTAAEETAGNADSKIQAAITALPAGGGTVYLMEGTYTIDTAISIPSNVTLSGAGASTIIKLKNGINANIIAIVSSDSINGNSGITIRDLLVDGNKANNTSGSQYGMLLSSSAAASSVGITISNTIVQNFRTVGLEIDGKTGYAKGVRLTNNIIRDNDAFGLFVDSLAGAVIANNIFSGNVATGAYINDSYNLSIVGNVSRGNGQNGIELSALFGGSVTGNTAEGNIENGLRIVVSDENVVSSNKLDNNGGSNIDSGIHVQSSDRNSITNNDITDTAGTGFAINISNSASDTNYLAGNRYSGTGATTIQDLGTGTIYGGQLDGSNNFLINPAANIELQSNTNVTGDLDVSGTLNVGTGNALTVDATGNLTTSGALTVTNATLDLTTGANQDLTVEANGTGVINLNDTVRIGALAATDTDSYTLCRDASSGQLAACDANTTGKPFLQGGNTFGAAGDLGTNDAFALNLRTGGTTKLTVSAAGDLTFAQGANRTLTVAQATTGAGNNLTLAAGQGAATNGAGGVLALTGGAAGGTNQNGGNITINGGAGTGTGTRGDVILQASGGNVGIGTSAAPTSKLEVAGLISSTGSSAGLSLASRDGSGASSLIYSGSGEINLYAGFQNRLSVLANGNVGIGTTAAASLLDVTQPNIGYGTVTTNGTTTLTGVQTDFTNTFKVGDTINVTGETSRVIASITNNTSLTVTVAFTTSASGLQYSAVGGSRLTVKGNGNVGIGTANPGSLLTVATGNTNQATIVSDLSAGARSTYPMVISQANNVTNNNSVGLLQLSNIDTGSTAALLRIDQVSSGTGLQITGIGNAGTAISISNSDAAEGVKVIGGGAAFLASNANGDVYSSARTTSGNGAYAFSNFLADDVHTSVTGAFTGNLYKGNLARTITGPGVSDTGNLLNLNRSNTINSSGNTYTLSGDLATLSSNCTQTLGTCTDTSNILELNQQYANASGSILNVLGAGTGNLATLDASNTSANGVSIDVQSSSSSQYALNVTANNGATNVLYVRADGNVGIGTVAPNSLLSVGSANQFQVSSTGTVLAQTSTNSTTALQVQNAAGTSIFNVDTTNAKIGTANTTTASTNSAVLTIKSGDATGTTSNSGNVVIDSGSATGTAGNISIGTAAAAKTITLGNTQTGTITTFNAGAYSLNIRNTGVGINATAPTTGTVDLFFGSGARTININQSGASTAGGNLTIAAGMSGTGVVNGGDLILQAGATGGTGATGSVIVRANGTNSPIAFQIQQSNSTVLLAADTTNRLIKVGTGTPSLTSATTGGLYATNSIEIGTGGVLRIGDGTNGIDFTAGTAPSNTNPFFKGSSRPTRRISLVPEYAGATMTGTGSGTMTSDFCSSVAGRQVNTNVCGTTGTVEHNYYSWTAASGVQSYDVYVRYQLPSDFDGFSASDAIKMAGWRTDGADATPNNVTLTLYQQDGVQCVTATNVATGTGAWSEPELTGDERTCSFAAGDMILFKVTMRTNGTDFVRAGAITLNYLSKF